MVIFDCFLISGGLANGHFAPAFGIIRLARMISEQSSTGSKPVVTRPQSTPRAEAGAVGSPKPIRQTVSISERERDFDKYLDWLIKEKETVDEVRFDPGKRAK